MNDQSTPVNYPRTNVDQCFYCNIFCVRRRIQEERNQLRKVLDLIKIDTEQKDFSFVHTNAQYFITTVNYKYRCTELIDYKWIMIKPLKDNFLAK